MSAQIVQKIEDYSRHLATWKDAGRKIGFVPTMGALHEGHLRLFDRSKEDNDISVASIFVNPLQFGPSEDFDSYPRRLIQDQKKADTRGIDLIFAPDTDEIFAQDRSVFVDESQISQPLCGAFRKGHFQGVCTIVLKLLNIVRPDRIYLGEKDAQQLRVIEKMVSDLNVPVEVIGCETVREPDGLAMSSRNSYLTKNEREVAPTIYAALKKGKEVFLSGERDPKRIISAVKETLGRKKEIRIQYLEIRRWKDFQEAGNIEEKSVLAVAAFLGKTRLIDNVILRPDPPVR